MLPAAPAPGTVHIRRPNENRVAIAAGVGAVSANPNVKENEHHDDDDAISITEQLHYRLEQLKKR